MFSFDLVNVCNRYSFYVTPLCIHNILHLVGHLRKAASAVATFLAREPSDNLMASNVRYYMSELKLLPEEFVPRQVNELQ